MKSNKFHPTKKSGAKMCTTWKPIPYRPKSTLFRPQIIMNVQKAQEPTKKYTQQTLESFLRLQNQEHQYEKKNINENIDFQLNQPMNFIQVKAVPTITQFENKVTSKQKQTMPPLPLVAKLLTKSVNWSEQEKCINNIELKPYSNEQQRNIIPQVLLEQVKQRMRWLIDNNQHNLKRRDEQKDKISKNIIGDEVTCSQSENIEQDLIKEQQEENALEFWAPFGVDFLSSIVGH